MDYWKRSIDDWKALNKTEYKEQKIELIEQIVETREKFMTKFERKESDATLHALISKYRYVGVYEAGQRDVGDTS